MHVHTHTSTCTCTHTQTHTPGVEGVQEKAWSAVVPLVIKLKTFYEFSQKLGKNLNAARLRVTGNDEFTMTNPAIQNDFSYYRRTISRMRINNLSADAGNEVNNELANRMSLFYASATPMLKTLSDATSKFVSDNPDVPIENTTDCLSTMASVCKVMLETPEYRSRFTSEETVLFCLRSGGKIT
uniref:Family with sequence similarity 49 member Ba n=1 Tax=Seriola lalandi dorsalis TaxID=1841481 RepID=A0A3B4XGS4_SERLL